MAAKTAKAFGVVCPKCMAAEPSVVIDLNNLDVIECRDCDETFTAEEAAQAFQHLAAKWRRVAEWVELADRV
jgi:hypothetical protein